MAYLARQQCWFRIRILRSGRRGYGGAHGGCFPGTLRKNDGRLCSRDSAECWPLSEDSGRPKYNSTVVNLVSGSAARRIGSPRRLRLGHGYPPADCSFASSPDLDSGNSPPDFSSASSPARPRLHSRATISSVCCWPCTRLSPFSR